jgi:CRP/FNR family transcriptional regulator
LSPRSKGLFKGLSIDAISELKSVAEPFHFPNEKVLIVEDQEPHSILLLLNGRVRLSITSANGRRLILGVASPGEVLGLTSAVSNNPYDMTAETQIPCDVLSIPRPTFLGFLIRYPVACQNVAIQLSLEYKRSNERLRILGLNLTAAAKLAHLLLDWCSEGECTVRGKRIQCTLSHGEIGDCIGISRETVTRSLQDFKNQGLLQLRGSIFIIPSCNALAIYAGIGTMQDPDKPAA